MATALQQQERGNGFVSEDARRQIEQTRTDKARHIQELNLQREYILSQHTSSPARRTALMAALVQIEGQIQAMN
jgi:hypothetical protein